jgi:adenosine deaminase
LGEYLSGFQYTCAVLTNSDALARAAYELAWDCLNESVCYIEVRFAPQLHMHEDLDIDTVLLSVNAGLEKAQQEYNGRKEVVSGKRPPFYYGIIACALRKFDEHAPQWYGRFYQQFFASQHSNKRRIFESASLELVHAVVRCRDHYGIPIVGFDLAGQEDGYPARHHKKAFQYAHDNFLQKTVHAGEAYGPESIFEAITTLYANRIGHGYHLFSPEKCHKNIANPVAYTQRLQSYIANNRITIEVCISSNLQTNPKITTVKEHHFGQMLQAELSATICTDNRLVSDTTVTKELKLAVDAFEMTKKQIRNTLIYGFKRSFFFGEYNKKRRYVRKVIDCLDDILDTV